LLTYLLALFGDATVSRLTYMPHRRSALLIIKPPTSRLSSASHQPRQPLLLLLLLLLLLHSRSTLSPDIHPPQPAAHCPPPTVDIRHLCQYTERVTSRNLWSRYDRHFVGITRHNASRWLGSRVVSVLDSGAVGPGFKSQPRRRRVPVLGKLFTPIVPLFTKQRNW